MPEPTKSLLQSLRSLNGIPDSRRWNRLLEIVGQMLSTGSRTKQDPWQKRRFPLEPYLEKTGGDWYVGVERGRPIGYDGEREFGRVKITMGSGTIPADDPVADGATPMRLQLTDSTDQKLWLKTLWVDDPAASMLKTDPAGFEFVLRDSTDDPPTTEPLEEWIFWCEITWPDSFPVLSADHLPFPMLLFRLPDVGSSSSSSGSFGSSGASSGAASSSGGGGGGIPPVICYTESDLTQHEMTWNGTRYVAAGLDLTIIEYDGVDTWSAKADIGGAVIETLTNGDPLDPTGDYSAGGNVAAGSCDGSSSSASASASASSGPKDTHIEQVIDWVTGRRLNVAFQPVERPYGAFEDIGRVLLGRNRRGRVEIHPYLLQSVQWLRVIHTQPENAAVNTCARIVWEGRRAFVEAWSPRFLRNPQAVLVTVEGAQTGALRGTRFLERSNRQRENNLRFWAQAHGGFDDSPDA